ncbi:lipopolysaccharide transport periplasmic protein LptA [Shimia gijangensis]|uniref:lipopolysaccharide transport periplasmic protein LptA n=1 Tax=Shimia gijangensis TaxID=1470563 RepID=UPI002ADDD5A9|nr:lipopolysaccharide transport periplasmic protein LptA [Shimia gijangensis]
MSLFRITALIGVLMFAFAAHAQQFEVAFGGLQQDTEQPVEITSDSLSLNQNDGTALFKGNVLIIQGSMRISAPEVLVIYNQETSGIDRLEATGRVLLVKEKDAAEADRADYNISAGTVVMTGDVLLTQGPNTLNSNKMTVDLNTGSAEMEGRVKTILKTGDE